MGKRKKTRARKNNSRLITFSLILCSAFVIILTIYKIVDVLTPTSAPVAAFPKLELTLSEYPIEQVDISPRETEYQNNSVALTVNNETTTFENVEFKGHGNSTWLQAKKSYQIKLPEKASLLNFDKAKKWLLISNSLDPSHLRNSLSFYLKQLLEEDYPIGGDYVELYIDGSYRGLYYLSEKVGINKSRVDLKDSYGIIAELDNIHGAEHTCNYTALHNCLVFFDSVNKDNQTAAMNSFLNSFNDFELALKEHDYQKVDSLVDLGSFAKYYLLSEFSVNPDAYSSSFFFYQDGPKGKIHAGPSWDFDYAFSNTNWAIDQVDSEALFSPAGTNALKTRIDSYKKSTEEIEYLDSIATIVYDLLDFPEFSEKVKSIYRSTLSGHRDEIIDYLRNRANYIRDAAYRDASRWKAKTDFNDSVDYLIDWVSKRFDHFETTFGPTTTNEEVLETPKTTEDSEVPEDSETLEAPNPAPESPKLGVEPSALPE